MFGDFNDMSNKSTMQLGMIGLGRMGSNMVRRLIKDGHAVSISVGPRCTTANMNLVKEAMPDTVKDFNIVLPNITQEGLVYATYDVEAMVKKCGRIPALEEIYGKTLR